MRLSDAIVPVDSGPELDERLLALVGDARVVLLGEATHGTHEFYRERHRITRLLVERLGFRAVAVEADWPDGYRVNRYVRDCSDDPNADVALSGFRRFPTWMWRNTDVVGLVEWLRDHNEGEAAGDRVGFYGLDLYSLYASMAAVIEYLDTVDPEAAARARYRYSCLGHYGEDPQAYGYAAEIGVTRTCEAEVLAQLLELQRRAAELARRDGRLPEDEHFFARENARLVRNAEEYYRTMYRGRADSWNLRDRHMAETLGSLLEYLDEKHAGRRTRAVVWAHNSHIGDARATEMSRRGEWNIGELARRRFGAEAFLMGFTTYTGTVTAARDWGAPARQRYVRAALDESYEALLHDQDSRDFLLPLGDRAPDDLPAPLLNRAIGVIYRPETERISHYFEARLAEQFDAVIHFDETRAVEPLERTAEWETEEVPETYPTGL